MKPVRTIQENKQSDDCCVREAKPIGRDKYTPEYLATLSRMGAPLPEDADRELIAAG